MTRARWRSLECGVTAIEYALIGALIFLVLLVALVILGDEVFELYRRIADEAASVMGGE